jgi:hypothetical protein
MIAELVDRRRGRGFPIGSEVVRSGSNVAKGRPEMGTRKGNGIMMLFKGAGMVSPG